MEKNGAEWWKLCVGGGTGHSTRDVGCGGLRRDVVQENMTKMGENGTKCPFFTVSLPPVSRRSKIFPHSSLCKTQLTALTDGKMGTFATHRTLAAMMASADP